MSFDPVGESPPESGVHAVSDVPQRHPLSCGCCEVRPCDERPIIGRMVCPICFDDVTVGWW